MRTNEYKQNEFRNCSATIRPDYCIYPTNICCFNCDNNKKCTIIAKKAGKMIPCKPIMSIKMKDGKFQRVQLFDKTEVCEWSL